MRVQVLAPLQRPGLGDQALPAHRGHHRRLVEPGAALSTYAPNPTTAAATAAASAGSSTRLGDRRGRSAPKWPRVGPRPSQVARDVVGAVAWSPPSASDCAPPLLPPVDLAGQHRSPAGRRPRRGIAGAGAAASAGLTAAQLGLVRRQLGAARRRGPRPRPSRAVVEQTLGRLGQLHQRGMPHVRGAGAVRGSRVSSCAGRGSKGVAPLVGGHHAVRRNSWGPSVIMATTIPCSATRRRSAASWHQLGLRCLGQYPRRTGSRGRPSQRATSGSASARRSRGQQRHQLGPAAGAAALHRARRAAQDGRRLLDRVALHVDQHQRRPLVGVEPAQGGSDLVPLLRPPPPGRSARARPARASGPGPRAAASAARTFRLRSRSRQALTTTRCSQVVTAASPRKLPARRKAAM